MHPLTTIVWRSIVQQWWWWLSSSVSHRKEIFFDKQMHALCALSGLTSPHTWALANTRTHQRRERQRRDDGEFCRKIDFISCLSVHLSLGMSLKDKRKFERQRSSTDDDDSIQPDSPPVPFPYSKPCNGIVLLTPLVLIIRVNVRTFERTLWDEVGEFYKFTDRECPCVQWMRNIC